jgi:hypothetical protein
MFRAVPGRFDGLRIILKFTDDDSQQRNPPLAAPGETLDSVYKLQNAIGGKMIGHGWNDIGVRHIKAVHRNGAEFGGQSIMTIS